MSFLHHLHHQIPERPPSTVWVISHWTCTTSCSILCTPRSYGKALPNQMLQNHLFSLCIFACFLPPPLPLRTHFMMPDMRARPNTTTPLSTFGVDRFEYIYIYIQIQYTCCKSFLQRLLTNQTHTRRKRGWYHPRSSTWDLKMFTPSEPKTLCLE